MEQCSGCGISEERAQLFEVISGEGVVRLCKNCLSRESFPVIRKPSDVQLKESERRATVYERLSKAAGFNSDKSRRYVDEELLKKRNVNLREIIDRNYQRSLQQKKTPKKDLIENFHWVIMRARRAKKITTKQIAEKMNVPEMAVKLAEQGTLPDDYHEFIIKLERTLDIGLMKTVPKINPVITPKSESNPVPARTLTISDLKQMKELGIEIPDEIEEEYGMNESDLIDEKPDEKEVSETNEKKTSGRRFRDLIFGR